MREREGWREKGRVRDIRKLRHRERESGTEKKKEREGLIGTSENYTLKKRGSVEFCAKRSLLLTSNQLHMNLSPPATL